MYGKILWGGVLDIRQGNTGYGDIISSFTQSVLPTLLGAVHILCHSTQMLVIGGENIIVAIMTMTFVLIPSFDR